MTKERFRRDRKRLAIGAAGILGVLAFAPAPVGAVTIATVPVAALSAGEPGDTNDGESPRVRGAEDGAPPGRPAADPSPLPAFPPFPSPTLPRPAPSPPAASTAPAPSPAPAATPTASPAPAPAPAPGFGAYLHYSPRGITDMAAFSRWLGGREVTVGHTYLPGDVWQNIEGAPAWLADWAAWYKAEPGRTLVLNVPMLERTEARVPDAMVARELRRGAAGAYDGHFERLARRLVGLGVKDAVLVVGWEMNGTTYTHRCGPDPRAWRTYWARIARVMNGVEGAGFRFDFTPTRGRDATPWTECYPGDDVVDIVGMDSYDQPYGTDFDRQISEPYGLQAQVDFAAKHGKAISYPEWGLFKNGDNAEYMRRMIRWMDAHPPLYQTISDYCPHGVWQCRMNQRATAVYRQAFKAGGGLPAEGAGEKEQAPMRDCRPVRLGGWLEERLGGRLCVRFNW
ncbi:glycoside hydrolase family 26 protein [Streptomyces sp. DT18]